MILALVVFQMCWSHSLVSQPEAVEEPYARLPVSKQRVARDGTVYVVLPSCKIPHEVPPVHPVHLIVQEECEVLHEGGFELVGALDADALVSDIRLVKLYV